MNCRARVYLLLLATVAAAATPTTAFGVASSLTLFHNNDGESKLLGSGAFGGFDYFLNDLDAARTAASATRDVLTISSGDNFLAGLAYNASKNRIGGVAAGSVDAKTQNYYDALALAAAGYDAISIGNHEFDFGPDVLADFIGGYNAAGGTAPFLSSNLNFSGEAALDALVTSGDIASHVVVSGGVSGEKYGIIGVTTPLIGSISSPGAVAPTGPSLADVAAAINAEVTSLSGMGVNRIILSGHLQALSEDQALVPMLSGVDVIIAGGGDDLLRNGPDANTSASFGPSIDGPYPVVSSLTDLDGKNIPIVTTQGEYRYVGQLEVEFDALGNVTSFGGASPNPILVDPTTSTQAVGVFNGIDIQSDILNPLAADVATLEATVVASTDVPLDGRRASVRTMQTNLGSLITDAYLWQAAQIGGLTGDPVISATNGGGIRNDSVLPVGDLTAGDMIGVQPFANSVVVINGLTVDKLVGALENSIGNFPGQSGGFLQIGGFSFVFNENTGAILEVSLDDGTVLYTDAGGDLYGGTLDLVTNSFTAGGGDGYDEFAMFTPFDLSVNYGDAVVGYIQNALGGAVAAGAYPEGGNNRIQAVIPEPAALSLLVFSCGLMTRRRS